MAFVRTTVIKIMTDHGFNLLTPDELSALSKKDIGTIYRHIRNGELPARKIKGSLRISLEDAIAYLEGDQQ